MTQASGLVSPKPIMPRQRRETRRPQVPRFAYFIVVRQAGVEEGFSGCGTGVPQSSLATRYAKVIPRPRAKPLL